MLASDLLRFPALDGPGLFLRSSLRFEQLTYPVRLGWRCAMFGLFLALETLQLFQVQGCEKVLYRNSIGSFFRKAVGLRSFSGCGDARYVKVNMIVRSAQPKDAVRLAALKEAWAQLSRPVSESERREFAEDLAAWMRSQGQALVCNVADVDGELVGMAWLVLFERVPDIHDRTRLTGDIQSVYVLPQHRQRGIGSALVRSLIDAADERGVPRVTVSANAAAAGMYSAEGFVTAPYLLERPHR